MAFFQNKSVYGGQLDNYRTLPMRFPDDPVDTDDAGIYSGRQLGTFKDSLRKPVYRWFRYPAGYSYKFVAESVDLFGVSKSDWLYDPFSGTGTTLIFAKQAGYHAYGVEAHSFVHWIADVKLFWEFNYRELDSVIRSARHELGQYIDQAKEQTDTIDEFPELVHKCYHPHDLIVLFLIREYINTKIADKQIRDFFKLALTNTLRTSADAGTGWPYIAPKKGQAAKEKGALKQFWISVGEMRQDLESVRAIQHSPTIVNQLGDSREKQTLEDGQVKLAITSPPYLNNYDYADRTRLETYFWGITQSWSDITALYRDKLIVAATTQVRRSKHDIETLLDAEIEQIAPDIYAFLRSAIRKLADLRQEKRGKKDYDIMTGLYFNDMLRVIKETYRVLSPKGHFCLVLGDSAPYGVHIETDNIIGQLAQAVGFTDYQYHELRKRGGKWKENPQRHRVPLREGVVVLTK